jgi:hypothetical protein
MVVKKRATNGPLSNNLPAQQSPFLALYLLLLTKREKHQLAFDVESELAKTKTNPADSVVFAV